MFNLKTLHEQIRLIILLGIAVVLLAGWFWLSHIFESPRAVFWGMFSNSLSTASVTRQVTETGGGQNLKETIILELGKNNIAQSNTVLSEGNSVVSTETIGTPQVDYTRYISAKTNQKTTAGKPINFSSIIGIWGKSTTGGLSADPLDHLFGQTLLGIVPIGNLPPIERTVLLNQMKTNKVFNANFSKIQHGKIKGRSVDIFQVSVSPVGYAQLLTAFAKDLGYQNVPELNPSNYRSDSALKVQFDINPASRQLVQISYPGSNHVELYGDYGVKPNIAIPNRTISTAALEQKLLKVE